MRVVIHKEGFAIEAFMFLYWNLNEDKTKILLWFSEKRKKNYVKVRKKMRDEEGGKKKESDYVQMIIYKEVIRNEEGSGCWWFNLQKKKRKKMKKYLPSLFDDLPRNLCMFYLYLGGIQRIDHRPEPSPRSHYNIKSRTSMKWYVLRRRTSSWTMLALT